MTDIKTKVIESLNGGHQVVLSIDHQSFNLEEKLSEEGMTSKEYAEWYKKQLDIALERITTPLPMLEKGDKIKLYGKETTVEGFRVHWNEALKPPQYEIILLTTGRGDPFKRSLDKIELLDNN